MTLVFVFFFSSRRRHTRFDCDWSSDVCSSDLNFANGGFPRGPNQDCVVDGPGCCSGIPCRRKKRLTGECVLRDRKSTRLNSSHSQISYAVFCLKKKKNMTIEYIPLRVHHIKHD